MKKSLKIMFIIIAVVVGIIVMDTIQAIVFNNSPLLKIRENFNGGSTHYIDKGLVVNHYNCTNKEKKTLFKKAKYSCPIDENKKPNEVTENKKELLKLVHFSELESTKEDTSAEFEEKEIKISNISFSEIEIKPYEKEKELDRIVKFIKKDCNIDINNKWKYYVHYVDDDEQQKWGYIVFIYYFNDVISTNRAITFSIQKNEIVKVSYSYLNEKVDEEKFIKKYQKFLNTYEQEKVNVLGDNYEIDGDITTYKYNYRTNRLIYTYNIFYRQKDIGIINNDYGTQVEIK